MKKTIQLIYKIVFSFLLIQVINTGSGQAAANAFVLAYNEGPTMANKVKAKTESKQSAIFHIQRADTNDISLPEWYFSPPADYIKDDMIHYVSASWGRSYERALIYAIINIASKIERKVQTLAAIKSEAEGESGFDKPIGVSIVLDSILVVGADIMRGNAEDLDANIYSSSFHSLFKLRYKDGSNHYSVEALEGESIKGEKSSYSQTFTIRETDDGYTKFLNYLKESPRWRIRKREIINEEYVLLLEYIEEKNARFNFN